MTSDYLFITSNTIKQGIPQRKLEGVESQDHYTPCRDCITKCLRLVVKSLTKENTESNAAHIVRDSTPRRCPETDEGTMQ